jgi:hypothetical protein
MRKYLFVLFVLLCSGAAYSQIELRGSLGLSMVNMPSLRDYLNINYMGANQLSSFQSAVEFGFEAGYRVLPAQYGIEAALELNSFNGSGGYEMSYTVFKPSFMYYRVSVNEGYQLKIGAGIGPRFLSVSEKNYTINETKYSSTGWGIVGRADASTQLSSIAYAYIGGELRYDYLPAPKTSGGDYLLAGASQSGNVKFSAFSAGIKIGVLFIL